MKMKKSLLMMYVLAALAMFACNQPQRSGSNEETDNTAVVSAAESAFLSNLAQLCGKSFKGKEVYVMPGRESWAEKNLVMHVRICEETQVQIPFHIDQDQSRTWMFLMEDGRLRFRHDHRHEDGTPEDQTLYGGYADGTGNEFSQSFPADEYTRELINDDRSRQWNVVLSEDLSTFTYELLYQGERVFAAEFDLTQPL
jgi:hypothetical protein